LFFLATLGAAVKQRHSSNNTQTTKTTIIMSFALPPNIPNPYEQQPQQPPQHNSLLANAQVLASQTAQEKINRELFVGNTPPGTSELLLLHYLNAAMRRVQLCEAHETPILNCRVSNKFAFIELTSPEMANRALSLSGILFIGNTILKVSRPSKYAGPNNVPSKTWQQITGQALPDGVNAFMDAESEKMTRELFVGNTTPEMTEGLLREFLGNAMEQVGLSTAPGNPINACRVSGKFAFVELRSAQEAANALNLNNIPFMGVALRVGRPSKWTGPPDSHGNWDDILAKYVAGELLPGNSAVAAPASAAAATAMSQQQPPSRVVELQHMLTLEDLTNDDEYQDVLEDTREECSQFGKLINVVIPRGTDVSLGATKVFLEYETIQDAASAIQNLQGRTFDGRSVMANFYDEARFAAMDYAG
jgi:RNA recognition motif. (a.k.a. RRM, RBD, or RNP domain)